MLVKGDVEDDQIDKWWRIKEYIPAPKFTIPVPKRVTMTHNNTWMTNYSRYILPILFCLHKQRCFEWLREVYNIQAGL